MRESIARLVTVGVAVLCIGTSPGFAQDGGGGGRRGSGSGGTNLSSTAYGDVFGDLIQILREPENGVPILQKRYVQVSGSAGAFEWGYCPIALTLVDQATGQTRELPFIPGTCDPDTTAGATIPIDYFGRLSAARVKQRMLRMHFDEVIAKIKTSQFVWRDGTGRMALGTECKAGVDPTVDPLACTWTVVDSPVENLAVYARLMKFGHLQTNPTELDTFLGSKGDPTAGLVYHPALDPAVDYAKFLGEARSLLPQEGKVSVYDPEPLDANDFLLAAAYLATGADKDGRVTLDLVQYMNRILKIAPAVSEANVSLPAAYGTLPALYRDCGSDTSLVTLPDGTTLPATEYQPGCTIVGDGSLKAVDSTITYATALERFVNYGALVYARAGGPSNTGFAWNVVALRPATTLPQVDAVDGFVALIGHLSTDVFVTEQSVPLYGYLLVRNGEAGGSGVEVDGFVKAASDALRAIEFVHNYKVPVDLVTPIGYTFEPLP